MSNWVYFTVGVGNVPDAGAADDGSTERLCTGAGDVWSASKLNYTLPAIAAVPLSDCRER